MDTSGLCLSSCLEMLYVWFDRFVDITVTAYDFT